MLMLAYMNRESLEKSLETGETWFWSRSRQDTVAQGRHLWKHAAHCGDHRGLRHRRAAGAGRSRRAGVPHRTHQLLPPAHGMQSMPDHADPSACERQVTDERYVDAPCRPRSWTGKTIRARARTPARLFQAGESEILKKLGEEAVEVVVAGALQGNDRMVYESADLVYHLLVALVAKGLTWQACRGGVGQAFQVGSRCRCESPDRCRWTGSAPCYSTSMAP